MEVEPGATKERYDFALDQRRVAIESTQSGTANLYAQDLPPDRASALMKRLNCSARSPKAP